MNRKITLTAIVLFFSASCLFSKNRVWNITLANTDKISTISLENVSLERLDNDSLVISYYSIVKRFSVESIVRLQRVKKGHFWTGAGIGLLAGGLTGGIIGLVTHKEPESVEEEILEPLLISPQRVIDGLFLGGLSGFFLGGSIGASAGKDEVFDLSQNNLEQKLEIIRMLVSYQQ